MTARPSLLHLIGYGECRTCTEAYSLGFVDRVGCALSGGGSGARAKQRCYEPDVSVLADLNEPENDGEEE